MINLPFVVESAKVPRLIHQTFYCKNLPVELHKNIENIKAMNPEWAYKLYDDDDITSFLTQNYEPTISAYYNRINTVYGAARADLFRYLLMYKLGGVYLDIKSTATLPLNDVIKEGDRFLLSGWPNGQGEQFEGWGMHSSVKDVPGGEYQQWHIIAVAGHPFLRAVIERVLKNIDRYNPAINGTGKAGVLRLTGPIAYTLAISPLLTKHPYRRVESHTDLGLNYSIYATLVHKTIFKAHYTVLTDSIVSLGPFQTVLAAVVNLIRKLRDGVVTRKT